MLVDGGSCADAEQMLNAEEERMRTENNRVLLSWGCASKRMKQAAYIVISNQIFQIKALNSLNFVN